jgi:allantoicase
MNFTELIDLAAERVGGAVLLANDEFFAPKENLLKPSAPIFIEGKYTDLGKWMDGWETRRKRTPGFDWCLIRLGLRGVIRGVLVDTSYFKGNYPEQCSLEACAVEGQPDAEALLNESNEWTEILPKSQLQGDSHNLFAIENERAFTHLRFKIYPDGGVARLRVYGEVLPDWERLARRGSEVDLAAIEHGAFVIVCSDMFFGHRQNLIMPGRALDMSDGWETKRRRGPGHDWSIIRLGTRGTLKRVEIDTAHFKGNFPESCSIEACDIGSMNVADWTEGSAIASLPWTETLARTKLQAHTRHFFEDELKNIGPVTHLRFNIFPDGGVSRLRVFGSIDGNF